MKSKTIWISAAALLLFAVAPLWAHHAFAAEYDENRPIKLQGKVTKWELVNPHSWIDLDVKGNDGKIISWKIEGGSPNVLLRMGFNKDSLPFGTEIKVEGFQAKDGANRAVGANLTFLDGKKLFLGGSAPGANGDAGPEK
jgi:hypothetical protein